jgi:pyridoxal phosphate enzyme (YggS family)
MKDFGHSGETFASRLAQVEESIAAACRHAGRTRESVQLMAVSKTHPASAIAEAVAAGVTLFGENRVQEFQQKAQALQELGIRQAEVHLIGHLQSNKTGKAAEIFSGIDTVDSLRVAERLQDAAAQVGKTLPILLEIKLSDEDAKTGLAPEGEETRALLERLPDLTALKMRGLMTVAPLTGGEAVTRDCFRRLSRLREEWSAAYTRLNFDELSMGMSGDFAIAIEEGSTCVRIGTALFGQRENR